MALSSSLSRKNNCLGIRTLCSPRKYMKSKRPLKQCFYCGALLRTRHELDHFPIPYNVGGTEVVPCCQSCHDMKDRFKFENWPHEWTNRIIADYPLLSRETKLFLAVSIRLFAEARQIMKSHGDKCFTKAPPRPRRDK